MQVYTEAKIPNVPKVVKHFGRAELVDSQPRLLARIKTSNPSPMGDIWLHPRYIPKDYPHTTHRVKSRLRGRTLYVLLDEPLRVGENDYSVINFKGVGADTNDREMVISPAHNIHDGQMVERIEGDRKRLWGAHFLPDVKSEFEMDNLPQNHGLEIEPHLAINFLPRKICEYIAKLEGGPVEELAQLARAASSSARLSERRLLDDKCILDPIGFANVDIKLIDLYVRLRHEGKLLYYDGEFADNRSVYGPLTDSENIKINNTRGLRHYEAAGLLAKNRSLARQLYTTLPNDTYNAMNPDDALRYCEALYSLAIERIPEDRKNRVGLYQPVARSAAAFVKLVETIVDWELLRELR